MEMSMANQRRAVVLLSGGLDSATALAVAKAAGFAVYAMSFDYGQRHALELECARRVAARAGVGGGLLDEVCGWWPGGGWGGGGGGGRLFAAVEGVWGEGGGGSGGVGGAGGGGEGVRDEGRSTGGVAFGTAPGVFCAEIRY